jgi:hypothetical protein
MKNRRPRMGGHRGGLGRWEGLSQPLAVTPEGGALET